MPSNIIKLNISKDQTFDIIKKNQNIRGSTAYVVPLPSDFDDRNINKYVTNPLMQIFCGTRSAILQEEYLSLSNVEQNKKIKHETFIVKTKKKKFVDNILLTFVPELTTYNKTTNIRSVTLSATI